jgi:hypothetical protein
MRSIVLAFVSVFVRRGRLRSDTQECGSSRWRRQRLSSGSTAIRKNSGHLPAYGFEG